MTSHDGKSWDLPPLLEWELRLTGGVPCDSFSLVCLYDKGMGAVLPECSRFSAFAGGEQVFYGVIDEYHIRFGGQGLLLQVQGRGLAALLLDNEAEAVVYQRATTADILRNHVTPYGIQCVESTALSGGYQVAAGSSQWRALEGFSRAYGGFLPRFDGLGRLRLSRERGGRTLRLGEGDPLLSLEKREKRYGVISEIRVVDKLRRTGQSVRNEAFLRRGGSCRRVLYKPGQSSWADMRYTGDYQIAQSRREAVELRVTLEGFFPGKPGDWVELELGKLGLRGRYTVAEAAASGGMGGSVTELLLREE